MKLVLMLPHRLVSVVMLFWTLLLLGINFFILADLSYTFNSCQLSAAPKGRIARKNAEGVGRYITMLGLCLLPYSPLTGNKEGTGKN